MDAPRRITDPARLHASLNDEQRLQAVQATGLLDTPPEESFDRLTRLAAKLTGSPATFVSLVDRGRDFYKSAYGFGEPLATLRQLEGRTFCHYALMSEGPLVLDDVTRESVFCDVPTVQSLGVRAYAGVPLVTSEGHVLGSFCAIDFKPKQWSEQDVDVLTELAHSAIREIELRQAVARAEASNQRLIEQIQKVDELNRRLTELATTDSLTGLHNRRAFEHALKLELAIAERRLTPLSLLIVDVDHFKQVNDQYGHPAGDKVLQTLARQLSAVARSIDVVARIGGEEFAALLPNTDTAGALAVAERMRVLVAEADWTGMPITVSIGTATLQRNETGVGLKERADQALYAAKEGGRNRVVQA
ncbi:MAG TPA: sensor domain-containing diguanylate cyclase [Curvibacter sp.]|nr:sensor domain-containing diguanylate cyclase [Curvibacter sp.]